MFVVVRFWCGRIAVPPPSLVQSQGGGGSLIRWAASQQGGSGAVAVVEGTLGTWVGWWTPLLGKGPWCFCFLFSSLNRKQRRIFLIGCLKFFGMFAFLLLLLYSVFEKMRDRHVKELQIFSLKWHLYLIQVWELRNLAISGWLEHSSFWGSLFFFSHVKFTTQNSFLCFISWEKPRGHVKRLVAEVDGFSVLMWVTGRRSPV